MQKPQIPSEKQSNLEPERVPQQQPLSQQPSKNEPNNRPLSQISSLNNQQPLQKQQSPTESLKLKLYVYGSCESDQYRHPAKLSQSKRPICISKVQKFDLNDDSQEQEQNDNSNPSKKSNIIPNPLYKKQIYKIACGGLHSVVLTTDGQCYTFGCNDEGALGRQGPENVPLRVDLQHKIDMVSAGDNHTLFANSVNGVIYFTGNYNYLRGQKMIESIKTPIQYHTGSIDQRLKNHPIQKIVSGANHTIILINNKIYCRGEPESYTTGRRINQRHKTSNSLTFESVGLTRVMDVWCGGYHTICKIKKGKSFIYFTWGKNDQGQLGLGNFQSQEYPVQIKKLRGENVTEMALGAFFSIFLLEDGRICGCGSHEYGQLGLGEDYEFVSSDVQEADDDEDELMHKGQEKEQKSIAVQEKQQSAENIREVSKEDLRKDVEKLSLTDTNVKVNANVDSSVQKVQNISEEISKEVIDVKKEGSGIGMQIEEEPNKLQQGHNKDGEQKQSQVDIHGMKLSGKNDGGSTQPKTQSQNQPQLQETTINTNMGSTVQPSVQNIFQQQPQHLGAQQFNTISNTVPAAFPIQSTNKKKYQQKNTYIKSIRFLEFPEDLQPKQRISHIASGAGSEFCFAWNTEEKTELYSWGFGMNYVLLNGEENEQYEPFKVRTKIYNDEIIYEMAMGGQHVMYTAYERNVEGKKKKSEVRMEDEVYAVIAQEKRTKLSRKRN